MATASTEIERKYSVDEETALPGFTSVGLRAGSVRSQELCAVYLDTADLTLTRNRITLRRRTGGDDAGWHVKMPKSAQARREIHADLAEGRAPAGDDDGLDLGGTWIVPESLRELVAELIGAAALRPVAVLSNRRDVHDLYPDDATGPGESAAPPSAASGLEPLAELCDDRVTATSIDPESGERQVSSWREWEIELVAGTVELFDRLEPQLIAAGAAPSDSPSKLARALAPVMARRLA